MVTKPNRRQILLGLAATGALPVTAFANSAGEPGFVTCCQRPDGSFAAAVLDGEANMLFTETLDGRGHGAAISQDGRISVVFARRPGRFALVLDHEKRSRSLAFEPPPDRHFYGHGFFSPDGRLLYATENDFEAERGVIGVYDVEAQFGRIGEFDTHGIGPHEAVLMRDGRTIAIANGGIVTHPDYPRQKLNLPEMEPTLVYLDRETGDLIDRAALPDVLFQLSIRHLAEAGDGSLWFGGQYEGAATDQVALIGTHRPGETVALIDAPEHIYRAMNQYVGSIAAHPSSMQVACTSPRGGTLTIWDARTRSIVEHRSLADVCGTAPSGRGFAFSSGTGLVITDAGKVADYQVAWDNHMAALAG